MFKKYFEVVEITESGVVITHILHKSRKHIKKDIEWFKKHFKKYQMVGKDGMIVWA